MYSYILLVLLKKIRWRGEKRLPAHPGNLLKVQNHRSHLLWGAPSFTGRLGHPWLEKEGRDKQGLTPLPEGGHKEDLEEVYLFSEGQCNLLLLRPSCSNGNVGSGCGWCVCLKFHSLKNPQVTHCRCLNYFGVGVRDWENENVWFLFRPWKCQGLGDEMGSESLNCFGVVGLCRKWENPHGAS